MLKYLYYKEIFREIPEEITLGISISGCIQHCLGCHSRELWEDEGTPLTIEEIEELLYKHKGVTCLCLLGGERDIDTLTEIFKYFHSRIKTAWYCGLDLIPRGKEEIIQYLDYYKIGHFDLRLGGLDKPTTNQRLYEVTHLDSVNHIKKDITHLFWKNN